MGTVCSLIPRGLIIMSSHVHLDQPGIRVLFVDSGGLGKSIQRPI